MHFFRPLLRGPIARGSIWLCSAALVLSGCGGGSGSHPNPVPSVVGVLPSPISTSSPSTSPSPTATDSATAFVCPTSDTTLARNVSRVSMGESRHRVMPQHRPSAARTAGDSQLVAVTYDAGTFAAQKATFGNRETALGAKLTNEYRFSHIGTVTHVLSVRSSQVPSVESALRRQAGVRAVGLSGGRRYKSSVSQPAFTNDPYFTGFSTTAANNGTTPAPTYEVGPLEESADVPGQWDMHAIRLEYAFAYSLGNNGSNVTNALAVGSSAVKIAIIDTGEDINHPELASKIAYQRCFLTNTSNVASMSNFSSDGDGHGTDVSGIAAAATNNGIGFTGAGGNVQLYAYRVFPTPNDNCNDATSSDPQCGTDPRDIASAINDAVANHVNVISMSLGGTACTSPGVDSSVVEGQAVANAIAANTVVVAASGNSGPGAVEAPACDTGVIAVGATAIADGSPNASNKAGGSASAPFEYVPTYSDFGSPAAAPGNPAAWGIVAPGGDPSDSSDLDLLHWIDNIWTTTPFANNGGPNATPDVSFAGDCSGDYPTENGTPDCRVFIAGTSMSTPHVAGAAALIISANPSYGSPAAMKQLLCSTADDISDANEGCGRLDVYRAMAVAVGDTSPPAAMPVP